MATTLATARTSISSALAGITTVNHYRRRQTNYQYPCLVVGWPQSVDLRPTQGDSRDFVIDVAAGVEVTDDDSCDDLLSSLFDAAAAALLVGSAAWDILPATDATQEILADGRVILWYRIPVAVFA